MAGQTMRAADLSNPLVDVIGLALVGILLALQFRERRVSVPRLWIIPALVLVLSALSVSRNPPAEPSGWAWLGLGLVLGVGVGVLRGALTQVQHVDRAGSALLVRSSLWGVMVWLVAFALRTVVRQFVAGSGPDAATASLASATLVMVALGTVLANTLALYRVYRVTLIAPGTGKSSSAVARRGGRGT